MGPHNEMKLQNLNNIPIPNIYIHYLLGILDNFSVNTVWTHQFEWIGHVFVKPEIIIFKLGQLFYHKGSWLYWKKSSPSK